MRVIFSCLMCLLILSLFTDGVLAQDTSLKFNKDGKFKIVQFTDVHFISGNPKSEISLERINEVLDAEKPDLVIFTGDIIYGAPAETGIRKVLNIVSGRKIPFGVVFGNHDDEQGMTAGALFDIIKTIPYSLTAKVDGLSGTTNFILPVKSSDGQKNAAVLYCMDSHTYSSVKEIGGYDYIKFDQIDWYLKNSAEYTRENGGPPLPALAFFHIPLPEYNQAASSEGAILIGTRKEPACAPQLNSGLFTAVKQAQDVMGIFVGHDHDNDYVVNWKGVLLGYGRYTGGNTVYNNLENGARVIQLIEGKREFNTWVRLKGGKIINSINYPAEFIKKGD